MYPIRHELCRRGATHAVNITNLLEPCIRALRSMIVASTVSQGANAFAAINRSQC